MKKRCFIFAAGDYSGVPDITQNDLIIAADAGLLHLKSLGITPDIAIGDFDSLEIEPEGKEIIKFKPEKDFTDTSLACKEAIERGYNELIVCGALGGKRFEHTFANIQSAYDISKNGADITLTDGCTIVKVITNSRLNFDANCNGYVSVFSLSEISQGVDLVGLKYSLSNATLSCGVPLGVSNEFTERKDCYVSVRKGTLAVIWKNSI